MLTPDQKEGRFISILADGKFHETVTEGTENAVLREYEDSKGNKGSKWELVYSKIEANIVNVAFHEGDFGKNIQITFSDGENEVTLSVGVASNFGEDLMKKLPGIDFAAKVKVVPYAFKGDDGKTKKGVTIWQNEEKISDFFWDGDNAKKLHGFPTPEGDTKTHTKDDWKIYFLQARKFLVAYIKENIVSKFEESLKEEFKNVKTSEDEIDPESIPF